MFSSTFLRIYCDMKGSSSILNTGPLQIPRETADWSGHHATEIVKKVGDAIDAGAPAEPPKDYPWSRRQSTSPRESLKVKGSKALGAENSNIMFTPCSFPIPPFHLKDNSPWSRRQSMSHREILKASKALEAMFGRQKLQFFHFLVNLSWHWFDHL